MAIPIYHLKDFLQRSSAEVGVGVLDFQDLPEEPEIEEVHQHSFYEVFWVEEGESRHRLDFDRHDLRAGSLFFISPGQVHEFEHWRGLNGGTLLFNEEYILEDKSDPLWLQKLNYLDNPFSQS